MPGPVTGSNQTASAFFDTGDTDTAVVPAIANDMPDDMNHAFGRIVTDTGKSPIPQSSSYKASTGSSFGTAATIPGSGAGGADFETQIMQSSTAEAAPGTGNAQAATADGTAPAAAAQMSEEDIQAYCDEQIPSDKHKVKGAIKNIEKQISDPSIPPELKQALIQLKGALEGKKPTLNDTQMSVLSILQRHADAFPIKDKDLQKKIDDPKTPPDLRAALVQLRADPALLLMLDTGRKGGGLAKADGNISAKDMLALSETPAMKTFNQKKAETYLHNYIPSDADATVTNGRDMTENDAMRELYLYSDNLPKKLSKDKLQKIVDGDAGLKKCPPQVIAAAKFMLDHPDSWSKVSMNGGKAAGPDGSIRRSAFLNNISKDVYLNADEAEALKIVNENRDVFLKGAITRKGLQKLIDDPNTTDGNRKAAQKLLDDPLLYGILDNAKHGHGSSPTNSADDGKIGVADIDKYLAQSTTQGKTLPAPPPTHAASTPEAQAALDDMAAGEVDDPAPKKKKGGGVSAFFHKIGDLALKVGALALHVISIGLSLLGKIPILGELAIPLSMAAEGMAGGLDVARTALDGGDVKHALKMAGIGIAGAAVSAVTLPGMGTAMVKGGEEVVEKTVVKAATTGAEKGSTAVVAKSTETATEKSLATSAAKTAEKGGEQGGKQSASAAAKEQIEEAAIDIAADLSVGAVATAVQGRQRKPSNQAAIGAADEAMPDARQLEKLYDQLS